MRKKYLSALLFGALLVTSAGTFTSCKDYDDEINNLQEQIDVIKADLATLTETVKNLDGVKDMSFTDGKLVIETGNGKKVEVDIPSATGVAKIELKDNVLYVNDEPKGEVIIPEDEDVKVEVKDGKLYINDEVQDLEIGSKVVMVDNGDGTYTMTVDDKSYVLPKASANITVSVKDVTLDNPCYFTDVETTDNTPNGGIYWTNASKDIDWKGPKGTIKTGDLLVGQMTTANIRVLPVSFDLSNSTLKLVDSEGKFAPANVIPVKSTEEGAINTGSRSVAGDNGEWELSIEPTAEAMGTDYTDGKNNLQYALSVDGNVVTDYVFVIDTQEKAYNATSATFEENKVKINGKDVLTTGYETGEAIEISYVDSKVYDINVTFNKGSQSDADRDGVKIDGYKVIPSNDAAGKDYDLDITIIDVNGNTKTSTINVKFTTANIGETTIATTNYTVTPADDKSIIINLEDVFTSLTDKQATDLANVTSDGGGALWTYGKNGDENNFLITVANTNNDRRLYLDQSTSITYYESEADAKAGKSPIKLTDETNNRVRNIKFAKLDITTYNESSETGTFNLTLTLRTNSFEIKTVTVPVKVGLPSFDTLFDKPTSVWNGSVVTLNLNKDGEANFYTAINAKEDVNITKLDLEFAQKDGIEYASYQEGTITIGKPAVQNNKLVNFTAKATYTFTENMVVKSDEFTINSVCALNGAVIENVNEKGESIGFKVTGSSATFSPATSNLSGVVIKVKDQIVDLKHTAKICGISLDGDGLNDNDNVTFKFDNQGDLAKAKLSSAGLKVEGLGGGNYTTVLTISIKDGIGVVTDIPISIEVNN